MRTDFTLDNKAVHLPNASTLGFGKRIAKRGDWITYGFLDGSVQYGRSVGRVVYTEPIRGGGHVRKVGIYLIALGTGLDFPMVRWIDAADVRNCVSVPPLETVTKLLTLDMNDKAAIEAAVNPHMSDKLEFGTAPWRRE